MEKIISNEDYDKVTSLQGLSNSIVNSETDRLELKKANMDAARQNAVRMLLFNQTYQERQKQYLILLSLFVFVFFICLAMVFVQERLGMTSIMIDLSLVVVVCVGGISAYFLYLNILNRDKLDFSKINEDGLLHPADKVESASDIAAKDGDITAITAEACVGAECCGPGFVYENSTCIGGK